MVLFSRYLHDNAFHQFVIKETQISQLRSTSTFSSFLFVMNFMEAFGVYKQKKKKKEGQSEF